MSPTLLQDRLQQYDKKVRRAVAEKALSQSKRSLEVGWPADPCCCCK